LDNAPGMSRLGRLILMPNLRQFALNAGGRLKELAELIC